MIVFFRQPETFAKPHFLIVIKNKFLNFQLVIFLKFVNSEVLQRSQPVFMANVKWNKKTSHLVVNTGSNFCDHLQVRFAANHGIW